MGPLGNILSTSTENYIDKNTHTYVATVKASPEAQGSKQEVIFQFKVKLLI